MSRPAPSRADTRSRLGAALLVALVGWHGAASVLRRQFACAPRRFRLRRIAHRRVGVFIYCPDGTALSAGFGSVFAGVARAAPHGIEHYPSGDRRASPGIRVFQCPCTIDLATRRPLLRTAKPSATGKNHHERQHRNRDTGDDGRLDLLARLLESHDHERPNEGTRQEHGEHNYPDHPPIRRAVPVPRPLPNAIHDGRLKRLTASRRFAVRLGSGGGRGPLPSIGMADPLLDERRKLPEADGTFIRARLGLKVRKFRWQVARVWEVHRNGRQ